MLYKRLNFRFKDTNRIRVEGQKKMYHAQSNHLRVIILILDKTDFQPRNIIRDREEHFIMIKRSIFQEDTMTIKVCIHLKESQYTKQNLTEMKGEIDKPTFTVEDFKIILSITDRIKQKISNDIENLIAIIQLTLPDIYRTLHPVTAEYTFFSSVHTTFTTTDCIPGHKTSFS